MAFEKWFKHTNSVIYSTKTDTVLLNYLTNEKIRHYMLDYLQC